MVSVISSSRSGPTHRTPPVPGQDAAGGRGVDAPTTHGNQTPPWQPSEICLSPGSEWSERLDGPELLTAASPPSPSVALLPRTPVSHYSPWSPGEHQQKAHSKPPRRSSPIFKRTLSIIKPAIFSRSSSGTSIMNSLSRQSSRPPIVSTPPDDPVEASNVPQKSLRGIVLSKIRRRSSHNTTDSGEQEPELFRTSPTLGVGTRLLGESNGLELSEAIGLGSRDGSESDSEIDLSEAQEVEELDSDRVEPTQRTPSKAPDFLTPLAPGPASASPTRKLSNIKGSLAKKIPNKLKEAYSEKLSPRAPSPLPASDQPPLGPDSASKLKSPRLPLRLRRKQKSEHTLRPARPEGDIVGLCFVEVNRASGLPYWKAVTRISFDMDPFVIISFGQKIFRTRVIRHSMDPVWDEKMFFNVRQHEMSYSILFNVFDWDKMSSNDYIGECEVSIADLVAETELKMQRDPDTGLYVVDSQGKLVGDSMTDFKLPIVDSQTTVAKPLSKDAPSMAGPADPIFNGTLFLRAKFVPYSAMRQLFWRKYLEQFDTDESGTISTTELTSMLDSLGSTLTHETISSFFTRFGKTAGADEDVLSFEQVVSCLEAELIKPSEQRRRVYVADEQIGVGQAAATNEGELIEDDEESSSNGEQLPTSASLSFTGHNTVDVDKPLPDPSLDKDPVLENADDPPPVEESPTSHPPRLRLERVVNISRCPICHKQRIGSQVEIDVVTHMAVCASQDWSTLEKILSPGNFVTSSQANRKWFTKIIGKVQNGRYSLGADSANIIVQDRRTGKLLEEKMQAYVRLGIRLMYKSGGSKDRMETQRMRRLLRSLTVKQGLKYNAPESAKEIGPFIAFHGLDLDEVRLPLDQFRTFNQFFYRELKAGARPIEAPKDRAVLTSCADCRMMVFDDIDKSRSIWIKARVFSLAKLLGEAGAQEAERVKEENKWALAIFRLAPQDYHRFHAPIDGVVEEMESVEGQYYTVNPMAIRSTIDVYGENVRIVVGLKTEKFGKIYCVFVGAMMVGSIQMSIKVGDRVSKGQDIGYFAFGGSTILTVVLNELIEWDEDLRTNSGNSIETLVRVGTQVGKLKS